MSDYIDQMYFDVIWEDLMAESEENKDATVKNKKQDVDNNMKDEINKENSTGMVNIENVGLNNVENLKKMSLK